MSNENLPEIEAVYASLLTEIEEFSDERVYQVQLEEDDEDGDTYDDDEDEDDFDDDEEEEEEE
jgi:hypothetical protein